MKAHRRQGTTSDICYCRLGPPSAVASKKRGSGKDPVFARVRWSFWSLLFETGWNLLTGHSPFTPNSRHLGGLCNAFGPLVRGVRTSRGEARRARGASAFDVKVGCGANIFITPTLTRAHLSGSSLPSNVPGSHRNCIKVRSAVNLCRRVRLLYAVAFVCLDCGFPIFLPPPERKARTSRGTLHPMGAYRPDLYNRPADDNPRRSGG